MSTKRMAGIGKVTLSDAEKRAAGGSRGKWVGGFWEEEEG
jgi:hypothetical protein